MRNFRREIREASFLQAEKFGADPDFEPSLKDMNRFFLRVVHVQRGSALRCNLDEEVVKGTTRIFTCDLKDEIAARPRLEPQPFCRSQHFVSLHRGLAVAQDDSPGLQSGIRYFPRPPQTREQKRF